MYTCVSRFVLTPSPHVPSRMTLHACISNGELLHSVMPVPISSFQKELVLQAVQKDQEEERSAALSLYCSALEHFVPAIFCKLLSYPVAQVFQQCTVCPKTCPKHVFCPQMRQTDNVKKPSGRR